MLGRLITAFSTGKWTIDTATAAGRHFYRVRPAKVDPDGWRLFDERSAMPGRCVFLTETGCEFSHNDRPHECRSLEPNPESPGKSCKQRTPPEYFLNAWAPYNDVVEHAAALGASGLDLDT
jgi:hypothetical protein